MSVLALWSAPRARSTAFFRSMAERGDMIALHEPFCSLMDFGELDVEGPTFDSAVSLLAWLRDESYDFSVFLKDTTDRRHREVLAGRRFLAEARHAFLIRHPDEIAASYFALPFIPQALTWEPGARPEWRRSARWHENVSDRAGLGQRGHMYTHTVENSRELARFAAHHPPFYEQLHDQSLNVGAGQPQATS